MDEVQVLACKDDCPELPIVQGDGRARAVVWPGVGASMRSMHHIRLEPSAGTCDQSHPMEAVYYVMAGSGQVFDPNEGEADPIVEGSMVHIEPGTTYRFEAGPDGMVLLGGPCPVDPSLYAHLAST
ncbi:MAG: cupin domain-containing protein [Geminicoccaceae bacterium]